MAAVCCLSGLQRGGGDIESLDTQGRCYFGHLGALTLLHRALEPAFSSNQQSFQYISAAPPVINCNNHSLMGFVKTCRTLLSADALLSITLPLALWFVLPLTVYFWAFKCEYCGDDFFYETCCIWIFCWPQFSPRAGETECSEYIPNPIYTFHIYTLIIIIYTFCSSFARKLVGYGRYFCNADFFLLPPFPPFFW